MARNKNAKRSSNKRQAVKTPSTNLHKSEKDCLEAPVKLASRVTKELNASRQKEAKLKNAIGKLKLQLKDAETKVKTATKTKNTSAGKKQLSSAKKAHIEVSKAHSQLTKDLQLVSKTLDSLKNKQTKLCSLGKYLTQCEKDWKKAAKQSKLANKVISKTKRVSSKPTSSNPHERELHVETHDSSLDNVNLDETTELAS